MPAKKTPPVGDESGGLEASMNKLEEIVSDLESGDASLEDALDKFEEGLRLGKHCKQILNRAELRVKQLVENADEELEEGEFDSDE